MHQQRIVFSRQKKLEIVTCQVIWQAMWPANLRWLKVFKKITQKKLSLKMKFLARATLLIAMIHCKRAYQNSMHLIYKIHNLCKLIYVYYIQGENYIRNIILLIWYKLWSRISGLWFFLHIILKSPTRFYTTPI